MPTPNPYDFVPLEGKKPERLRWVEAEHGLARYHPDRYSGRLICLLHPETPLFIHGQDQQHQTRRDFFRSGNRPAIPASSLKGALRSIYEIVADGCLSSLAQEYRGERGPIQIAKRLPQPYLPCHDLTTVCPACLLFGMVEQKTPQEARGLAGLSTRRPDETKTEQETPQEARGLAGRLIFSDAAPVKVNFQRKNMPAPGGGPQPRHAPFYFQDEGQGEILGRKLYFHHRNYEETIRLYGDGGRPGLMLVEMHSGDFTFTIDFTNLSETEMNALCYTLLLEENIRHHLAYGKAYGLGSARITIQQIELLHGPGQTGIARFLSLSAASETTINVESHARAGKAAWLARTGGQNSYDQFKRILAWPGVDLYKYPTFQWFRQTAGSGNVTLAEYQAGLRTKTATAPTKEGASQRRKGRVDMFNEQRGFGFIVAENGERIFVHVSGLRQGGPPKLQRGQRVEFEVRSSQRGPQAQDVVVIQKGGN